MKDKITKLNKTDVELSNGTKFTIVNDFKYMEGAINSFSAAFDNWLARTNDYTAESFVKYVKGKEPHRIFIELSDYEKLTSGKVEDATKEEYDAEQKEVGI